MGPSPAVGNAQAGKAAGGFLGDKAGAAAAQPHGY